MARPSKLTPAQWAEVERRLAEGEGVRDLAREFGVAHSQITRKFSHQTHQAVRNAAEKLAQAQTALAELPTRQQHMAVNLADKLRNISQSLASAAELGAKTAHRLQGIANAQAEKVDPEDPMADDGPIRAVAALTKVANESAAIAVQLLGANKDAAAKAIAPPEDAQKAAPVRERLSLEQWRQAHGL